MPEVRPVTRDNWRELAKLKVSDHQTDFVATNLHSIAEAQFGFRDQPGFGEWKAIAFGIYDEDKPVGFLMIGTNYSNPKMQGYLIRLMVDENFQRRGYGKFAMGWVIDYFLADARVQVLAVNYEPDNNIARALYASFGFVETGELDEGEVVAVKQLRS